MPEPIPSADTLLRRLLPGQLDVVNGHLVHRLPDGRHFSIDHGAPVLLLVAADKVKTARNA
jgi:hypothetical protein